MGKKSSKRKHNSTQEKEPQKTYQPKKNNNLFAIILGVVVGLIIFSFSGGSSSVETKDWVETTGTVEAAYELTDTEVETGAGYYADINYDTKAGETRTERSLRLKTDLSDMVGDTVAIKYDLDGSGVLVVGNVKGSTPFSNLDVIDIVFIVGTISVISGISIVIRRFLPSQEEYAAKHPKKSK